MQEITIGIVIADIQEYKPMENLAYLKSGGRIILHGVPGHTFRLREGEKTIHIISLLCGIGMVSAGAATAYLVSEGADYIINTGLSGGLSGVRRGDIVIGSHYVEHDFDLTPLGYERGQKPDTDSVMYADKKLMGLFTKRGAKPGGMAAGDSFISSTDMKAYLVDKFSAESCDMESAAVALVCSKAEVPFVAVRRISDDAAEDAPEAYNEMNSRAEATLVDYVFTGIEDVFQKEEFWT